MLVLVLRTVEAGRSDQGGLLAAREHESGGKEISGNYLIDNTRLIQEFGLQYLPYRQRVLQIINDTRREAGQHGHQRIRTMLPEQRPFLDDPRRHVLRCR